MRSTCVSLCLIWFVAAGLRSSADAAPQAPGLKVTLDIPEIYRDGKLAVPRTLQNRYPATDRFFVVLQDTSSTPIVIPDDDDANRLLHFEITTAGGKTVSVFRTRLAHAKYFPYDLRLEPGAVQVIEIVYGASWDALPFPHDPHVAETSEKVTIRAVFENKLAGGKAGYWTGKVVSDSYAVVLVDNPT